MSNEKREYANYVLSLWLKNGCVACLPAKTFGAALEAMVNLYGLNAKNACVVELFKRLPDSYVEVRRFDGNTITDVHKDPYKSAIALSIIDDVLDSSDCMDIGRNWEYFAVTAVTPKSYWL